MLPIVFCVKPKILPASGQTAGSREFVIDLGFVPGAFYDFFVSSSFLMNNAIAAVLPLSALK